MIKDRTVGACGGKKPRWGKKTSKVGELDLEGQWLLPKPKKLKNGPVSSFILATKNLSDRGTGACRLWPSGHWLQNGLRHPAVRVMLTLKSI